jgi:hypothetical protein
VNVEIKLTKIDSVQTSIGLDEKTGDLTSKIVIKAAVHPRDIARILNLQNIRAPLVFALERPQKSVEGLGFNTGDDESP